MRLRAAAGRARPFRAFSRIHNPVLFREEPMVFQTLRRHLKHAASARTNARLQHATAHAVEALEARRMLTVAMTPEQLAYDWNHLRPSARHDLAVFEYIYPEVAVRINEDLAKYGLTPIDPIAGTLPG